MCIRDSKALDTAIARGPYDGQGQRKKATLDPRPTGLVAHLGARPPLQNPVRLTFGTEPPACRVPNVSPSGEVGLKGCLCAQCAGQIVATFADIALRCRARLRR